MQFPKDFVWGAATASFQIEGATQADGRGESIWDRFCATPGKVHDGDTGEVACDHYHRYPQDVALMDDLGLHAYRFSIAWPRLFPTGSGRLNQAGLDFYRRLCDTLLTRGIRPMATLYHWDLPQVLEDAGGWANRETAYRFAEYAAAAFRGLGDRVTDWITLNEPWCSAFLGYGMGYHAPGHRDYRLAVQASHHLLLGHGLAVQAFRQAGAPGGIGITLNLGPQHPATASEADRTAARRLDGFNNRWFLDPVLKGGYPDDMLALYGSWAPLDYMLPDDAQRICQPLDFLGVNYYSGGTIRADAADARFQAQGLPPQPPLTEMGWPIQPEGLYDLLKRIQADYGDIPLYITENGAAFRDEPGNGDVVEDPQRVAYLHSHFAAAHRALSEGVKLKGYFVWSLLDNFEWGYGYSKRFGLVYIDYPTQRRRLKRSALWYRDVIRRGGLLAD